MTTDVDFQNQSLLVVDDNPINRKVVMLLLKNRIREIDMAVNGEEALEKFRKKPYDIVLMDVHMPGIDGYAASAAIRRYETELAGREKTRIIAMTASEEGEVIAHCYNAGMDAYVGKPFIVQQFFEVLKNLENRAV
ncbi:MAG: response regulator [Mangrovibacterium sp.]